jgi:hypothetical protein
MRGIESFLFGSLLIRWKLHPSALTLRQSALSAQTVEAVASWAAAQPGVQCFDIH